jgi:hypothetical protein
MSGLLHVGTGVNPGMVVKRDRPNYDAATAQNASLNLRPAPSPE